MPTLNDTMKALLAEGHTEAEIMDALRRQAGTARMNDILTPLGLDSDKPAVEVVVRDWAALDAFFDTPQRTSRRVAGLAIDTMRLARRNRNAKQLTKMALLALKSLSLS